MIVARSSVNEADMRDMDRAAYPKTMTPKCRWNSPPDLVLGGIGTTIMNAEADFSLLDVFDLPELQREIVVYLACSGPPDATTLAQATGLDLGEIRSALDALVEKGWVRLLADGQADAVLGRVESRTMLPAQFWDALLTMGRLYSEKDIAVLRTAVPTLQFARARLSKFSDHGPNQTFRVKAFASQLGYVLGLSQPEHMLLRDGALFYDIGNAVDRGAHYTISQEMVENLAAHGKLPLTAKEAEVVDLLCRSAFCHRESYRLVRIPIWQTNQTILGD